MRLTPRSGVRCRRAPRPAGTRLRPPIALVHPLPLAPLFLLRLLLRPLLTTPAVGLTGTAVRLAGATVRLAGTAVGLGGAAVAGGPLLLGLAGRAAQQPVPEGHHDPVRHDVAAHRADTATDGHT